MKLLAQTLGGALMIACLLAIHPSVAKADRDRGDIGDAKNELREQEEDLREAIADYHKERRQGDWRGAEEALGNIREERRAVAEARRDLTNELRDFRRGSTWNRGGNRRDWSEHRANNHRPRYHPVYGYRDRPQPRHYGWRPW